MVGSIEFCRFGDFQQDYPEIARLLLRAKNAYGVKNFVFDKNYCYHLTSGLNVERQCLIENPEPHKRWHIPFETSPAVNPKSFGRNPAHHGKRKPKIWIPHPDQTKLLEKDKHG